MRIEDAIVRWGGGTSLVMLARRARCHWCGRQGCHVQVTARDAFGRCRWLGETAEGQGDPRGERRKAGTQEAPATDG
ncbi:MAG: hypothetical protein F8N37_01250 [Telmatospirillum sp.]|nr:hypothetical protein [Telmatospirillum sp.]